MVLRALLLTFIDALRSEEYIVRAPRGPSVAAPRVARKKTAVSLRAARRAAPSEHLLFAATLPLLPVAKREQSPCRSTADLFAAQSANRIGSLICSTGHYRLTLGGLAMQVFMHAGRSKTSPFCCQ
jgi:hypothetical protein